MHAMTPAETSALIKSLARQVGFDLVGITRMEPSRYDKQYCDWIAAGKQGEMYYLEKGMEERTDLRKKFAWAKSVVCVALAYFQEKPEARSQKPEVGKIAKYAWGRDYHKIMNGKLKQLEARLRRAVGDFQARTYCDTGPILERELASRAGLGWIGKNTLLIHPWHGSYFVLGEMILDLELAPPLPDSPPPLEPDHCGTCRRCIEACPTRAIEPYSLDASRCISYLTLEHRGPIAEEFVPAMRVAGYIAGCDICQEVCPFNRAPLPLKTYDDPSRNRKGATRTVSELPHSRSLTIATRIATCDSVPELPLQEILAWSEAEWDHCTRGRAFRRAKLTMWQRNARIVRG